jgi:hypothetical protein
MIHSSVPAYQGIVPHLWLGGFVPGDVPEEPFTENVLSYAARNDVTVVLSAWNTTESDAARLRESLAKLDEHGIDAWLGTYDLRDYTDQELATNEDKRAEDTERLLRMIDAYTEYYPKGTVFTWHEPPNTGQWTGETRPERAESMVKYGPDIFADQKAAVRERYPDLDFGLMLWWHVVPPAEYSRASNVESLMTELADRDALPDFVYLDFYRGYYEWTGGYEGVNDVIRASIKNLKTHTDGRPVYYLGECHSLNNYYTPSKQSILGDLRTALAAGVDSYGWYIRKSYRETHSRNYNPFVPNHGTGQYREQFNTVVGSRDRFIWAFQVLFENIRNTDRSEQFDLWLHGTDMNFYQHGVELRTEANEWEFIGDVSGYLDGSERYSGSGHEQLAAFHGLDRKRFASDNIELRLTTYQGGDGATLHHAYAVPHLDAAHYQTESELAELASERSDIGRYALGSVAPDAALDPATETRVTVPLDKPEADIRQLTRPVERAEFERLSNLESDPDVVPSDLFDLWVHGDGLGHATAHIDGTPIEEYSSSTIADESHARVYRGLERSEFLDEHTGGRYVQLEMTADDPATLNSAFVMPYHGTRNTTADGRAASIICEDYAADGGEGQLSIFSLGRQVWPDGARLDTDDDVVTWLQVYPQRFTLARD